MESRLDGERAEDTTVNARNVDGGVKTAFRGPRIPTRQAVYSPCAEYDDPGPGEKAASPNMEADPVVLGVKSEDLLLAVEVGMPFIIRFGSGVRKGPRYDSAGPRCCSGNKRPGEPLTCDGTLDPLASVALFFDFLALGFVGCRSRGSLSGLALAAKIAAAVRESGWLARRCRR